MLLLALTGCEVLQRPAAPGPSAQPQPAPVPVMTAREREIHRLLEEAATAFEDTRLTTPVDDNAYYRYLRVLSLDPDNDQAEEGISNIVEKYLEWAIDNARQHRLATARRYLNKAKSVDDSHPSIAAVENLIARQDSSKQMTYRLAPGGIDERAPRVIEELHQIGKKIAQHRATVVIVGRTDTEGRWIYQQLNDATLNRVRARFELGKPPEVRLSW